MNDPSSFKRTFLLAMAVSVAALLTEGCGEHEDPMDEAMWIHTNLGPDKVPQDENGVFYWTHPGDAFKGMDSHVKDVYGHEFSPDEIKGRNTWVMWTGGNQEFWDYLAQNSDGIVDFLKLLDSRFVRRKDRFPIMGVIPSPGMQEREPDRNREPPKEQWTQFPYYGLSLDAGIESPDAFAEGGGIVPDREVYGYPSGIVGLWLFPRQFDPDPRIREQWEKNKHKWDPVKYLEDEQYYKDPDLVRPYRIGMSCGFCHISANPMNPPAHIANAQWSNLSSNIGSQYFWFGRVFGQDFKRDNLLWYLTNYAEPGSLDTSLVATDGVNNPNTMNSVFQVLPRLVVSLLSPSEKQSQDTLRYMPRLDQGFDVATGQVVDHAPAGPNDTIPLSFTKPELDFLRYLGLPQTGLPRFGDGNRRTTPKILAGGADSIGARGALCRVYLNIGQYSSRWVQLHNAMVGIRKQQPFQIKQCFERSLNWQVTMRRSTNVAKYFLAGTVPMRLENAPGLPAGYVKPNNDPKVIRGAEIFARDCFVCHSSLNQPERFWENPSDWKTWVQQPGYVQQRATWLVDLLNRPVKPGHPSGDPFFEQFVKENYLSTDARYHVTEIGTNSARALADNAGSDVRMWKDYSSHEFKNQERKTATIKISHPYRDEEIEWNLNTEAGPGNYRPHSLSSIWAHGPYLHNNAVGYYPYEWGKDPRYGLSDQTLSWFVDGVYKTPVRLQVFQDGMRRLLGLKSDPDKLYRFGNGHDSAWRQWYDRDAKQYRGFSNKPRRGFDSIVRIQENAAIVLPRAVIGDLIYMQTLSLFGIGIPQWVPTLVLIGIVVLGLYLFAKGRRRLAAGSSSVLRNVAVIVIGLALIGQAFLLFSKPYFRLGYIPQGTPVNLVANINGPDWIASSPQRKKLIKQALTGLIIAKKKQVDSLEEIDVGGRNLVDILIDLSKCPDLDIDRGHKFGWYNTVDLAGLEEGQDESGLTPVPVTDREALIEFLKKL